MSKCRMTLRKSILSYNAKSITCFSDKNDWLTFNPVSVKTSYKDQQGPFVPEKLDHHEHE